jgi:hypothetical protein
MNLQLLIDKLFYDSTGQMFVSGIFGLALALMFQKVCKDNCVIYCAPRLEEIKDKTFKLEDSCYKYETVAVNCNEKPLETYDSKMKPEIIIKSTVGIFY